MKKRYHGSRVARTNRSGRFALLLALALLLVGTVGGTVAYLVAQADPVTNEFLPSQVTCRVEEQFNDEKTAKTEAVVRNTGDIPAYIRVAVVANTIDGDGNITGMATLPAGWLNGTAWTEGSDGYYYYNGVVQPGDTTSNLLKTNIPLSGIQVAILASAIQSVPDDAVEEAWHMSYDSGAGKWTAVPSGS